MLSQEQIKQYRRDGFLVVPDLLTADEANAFAAYEDEPKPDGWRQSLQNHTHDAHWASLAKHPRIAGIVQQLLEARPMIVQTMYLEKQPMGNAGRGGTGTAMHQDLHYLPCEPLVLMACWVAISDTDPDNGGLCVVPGSNHDELHKTHKARDTAEHDSWEVEYLMRDRTGREWTEHMYSFEIEGLDYNAIQHLTVPKGGGVFFDGRTIHGSFGNKTHDRARRAFAIHYTPEGTWMFRDDVQRMVPAV